jgi:hypothetical protein
LIDIDVQSMHNYVEALAYSKYCLNHKHEGLGRAQQAEYMILGEARALDKKFDWTSSLMGNAIDEFGIGGGIAGGDTGLSWLDAGLFWE